MRLFTLQQRLKLMRQYKVKQRYINKLLEAISDTNNPDIIQKQVNLSLIKEILFEI